MANSMNRVDTKGTLLRHLGLGTVTFIGVGALLGGGVFTILGATIGLGGGGGTLLAIFLLAVGFLGIIGIYAELGTTFPETGGGYRWVREGLGDLQGFLSGWISWLAHAAACGLYSLSFGFYVTVVFQLIGIDLPDRLGAGIAAVIILIIFGFINWRGVKIFSRIGNIMTGIVLVILLILGIAGLWYFFRSPVENSLKFFPLFPQGIIGVLAAMSLFFIAFEGSEIQAQTVEEMKNPQRDLPRALILARIIITLVYLVITAALIMGFESTSVAPAFQVIGNAGERALPQAARSLIPFGPILVTIGGLLVNIAALNVTLFSSSHIALAMARSRHIFQGLAKIHIKNRTPALAVIISTVFIILLAVFFPIKEIASIASLFFIFVFLQVVLAFLSLRKHQPHIPRPWYMPFSPWVPLFTVFLLGILAIILVTHVSLIAGIVGAIWILFGLINYYAYATPMGQSELEEITVFTHTWRRGGPPRYRILLPLSPTVSEFSNKSLFDLTLAFAKEREEAEIFVLIIDETPGDHRRGDEKEHKYPESLLTALVEKGREAGVSTEGMLIESFDALHVILGFIRIHHINLAVLGWDGFGRRGRIFSGKVDAILREARCDLLVVKLTDLKHLKQILVCLPPDIGPHYRYIAKIASSIEKTTGGNIEVVSVLSPRTEAFKQKEIKERLIRVLHRMNFSPATPLHIITNPSSAEAILELEKNYDVVVLGAAREKFFKEIRVGSVATRVTEKSSKTVIVVKGHQGILPTFFDYLRERTTT